MRIGILHEGRLDLRSSQNILTRIISSDEEITFKSYPAGGQIINKMPAALALFKGEDVDLAIFITDIDSFPERRTIIKDFIREHTEMKIISAFCDVHFEEWFIAEKNALVEVLDIDPNFSFHSHPLRQDPKKLVDELISKKSKKTGETLFQDEIYPEIANKMNLSFLAKNNADYKSFEEELKKYFLYL